MAILNTATFDIIFRHISTRFQEKHDVDNMAFSLVFLILEILEETPDKQKPGIVGIV